MQSNRKSLQFDRKEISRDFVVISDFDGTISENDVGYELVKKFTKRRCWREKFEKWKKGEIGSEECTRLMYRGLSVSRKVLFDEILKYKLDSGFLFFLDRIQKSGIKMEIVSDGFDFYIDVLLSLYNSDFIPVFSNHLVYGSNSVLFMDYPYRNKHCFRCGNCKVRHVQRHLQAGKRVIYIGDSYTDVYAARISDVVFAKKKLAQTLVNSGELFVPYKTLEDVANVIESGNFNLRFDRVRNRVCQYFSEHDNRKSDSSLT